MQKADKERVIDGADRAPALGGRVARGRLSRADEQPAREPAGGAPEARGEAVRGQEHAHPEGCRGCGRGRVARPARRARPRSRSSRPTAMPVAVAKALSDAAKDTKILALRGGVLSGNPITGDEIERLAKLPPLEVLQAQLVGVIVAPLTQLAAVLNAPLQNLVGLINARITQLEEGGDTSAPRPRPERGRARQPRRPRHAVDEAAAEEAPAEEAPAEEPSPRPTVAAEATRRRRRRDDRRRPRRRRDEAASSPRPNNQHARGTNTRWQRIRQRCSRRSAR